MLKALETFNLVTVANLHGLDDALKLLKLAQTVVVAPDGSIWLHVPCVTKG